MGGRHSGSADREGVDDIGRGHRDRPCRGFGGVRNAGQALFKNGRLPCGTSIAINRHDGGPSTGFPLNRDGQLSKVGGSSVRQGIGELLGQRASRKQHLDVRVVRIQGIGIAPIALQHQRPVLPCNRCPHAAGSSRATFRTRAYPRNAQTARQGVGIAVPARASHASTQDHVAGNRPHVVLDHVVDVINPQGWIVGRGDGEGTAEFVAVQRGRATRVAAGLRIVAIVNDDVVGTRGAVAVIRGVVARALVTDRIQHRLHLGRSGIGIEIHRQSRRGASRRRHAHG